MLYLKLLRKSKINTNIKRWAIKIQMLYGLYGI